MFSKFLLETIIIIIVHIKKIVDEIHFFLWKFNFYTYPVQIVFEDTRAAPIYVTRIHFTTSPKSTTTNK